MATRGKVELEVSTEEDGTQSVVAELKKLNAELSDFASVKLESTLNLLGQAKDAVLSLGEAYGELEQVANTNRSFAATVKDATFKLQEARVATRGIFNDQDLRKRVMTMERLNLTTGEQSSLLESMAKIVVSTGADADTVFSQLIDTVTGSKDALKEYGIVLTDTKRPLDDVAASIAGIDLDKMSTNVREATSWWENLKGAVVEAWDWFKAQGIITAEVTGQTKDLTQSLSQQQLQMKALQHTGYNAFLREVGTRNMAAAQAAWAHASAIKALNAAIKSGAAGGFSAGPQGANSIASGTDASVTDFAEAGLAPKEKPKRRRTGGGRRRKPKGPAVDTDALIANALAGTVGGQGDANIAFLERQAELKEIELQTTLELVSLTDTQTMATVNMTKEIELQLVALNERKELALAEEQATQGLISEEERLHRVRMANAEAEQSRQRISIKASKDKKKLEKAAAKEQDASMRSQLDMWGTVIGTIGQAAATLADNEQDRAAIMAVFAVLDATMAGIRIISDMGVAGIPLAAATIALGAATAAGYASASGRGQKPAAPGGFGSAFSAAAIQERPDAAGAPVVMNFNAPVVGGTAQEIGGTLRDYTSRAGGPRRDAA